MKNDLQTTLDKSSVVMEADALDFRDQGNRVLNTARELRSQGGPESFIRDAEKIAADLRVMETLAWHQVKKTR